jgi:hypothetical protein
MAASTAAGDRGGTAACRGVEAPEEARPPPALEEEAREAPEDERRTPALEGVWGSSMAEVEWEEARLTGVMPRKCPPGVDRPLAVEEVELAV